MNRMTNCTIATLVPPLLVVCCLILPGRTLAEGVKAQAQTLAPANSARLEGKWLRTDGSYVLELRDATPDGRLSASYFNPKPINVSKAEWRRMGDRLQVFVELRDVNYPGSTYLVVYSPDTDRLEGYYHQAALGQDFDVVFTRMK